MSVTVSYSTYGFFILVLPVFSFPFIFDHSCIFFEFILFPCRIIKLLKSAIKGRHCRENAQRWKKAYQDMLIVFVDGLCFLG